MSERTDYDQIKAVNFSAVKHGRTSLPKMHAALCGLLSFESRQTSLGSMLHDAMRVGDGWDARYAVRPEGIDRRTKAGKEAWETWTGTLPPDAIIVEDATTRNDLDRCRAIVASLQTVEYVRRILIRPGMAELVLQADGRKAMIDRLVMRDDKPAIIIDWKTTQDATPSGFARSVARYGYAQQAAWYIDIVHAVYGVRVPFLFVAVESSTPYSVGLYTLPADQIEAARQLNDRTVKAYYDWVRTASTQAANHHATEPQEITVPEWAFQSSLPIEWADSGTDSEHPF
jgi:exodeoxyribonuclease VIII